MSHNVERFQLHAGDTRRLVFTVYEEDLNNPGSPDLTSPVDLTGAVVRWALSRRDSDLTPLVSKTTADSSILITDAAGGVFEVALEKDDTVGLATGNYFHEAEVAVGGDDSTVATGVVSISATVLD